ncbi:MAG: hypothetical protein M5U26_11015 [Planctomycetota bacterium]|nr:hypothetical protein [Planctomycetota bacterium]
MTGRPRALHPWLRFELKTLMVWSLAASILLGLNITPDCGFWPHWAFHVRYVNYGFPFACLVQNSDGDWFLANPTALFGNVALLVLMLLVFPLLAAKYWRYLRESGRTSGFLRRSRALKRSDPLP